jgi:hypothetical protein
MGCSTSPARGFEIQSDVITLFPKEKPMRLFRPHGKGQYPAPVSHVSVEVLENRRMLSGSIGVTPDSTTSPVAALTVNAVQGSRFKGEVGTWETTGLPTRGSGITAIAIVNWGDGRSSRARLVDDGSGTVQIVGVHVFTKPGTFQTLVNVEEFPRRHPRQITEIGQSNGEADVTPRPHVISLKGTFTGTYTTPLGNPDARSYDFTGAGTAHATGAASISGSITPPGFIRTGQAHGEFILTTDLSAAVSGTVTFDVTGHTQNGGGPLPEKLSYVITDGTGAFVNVRGRGRISVALDDTASTFVLVIH